MLGSNIKICGRKYQEVLPGTEAFRKWYGILWKDNKTQLFNLLQVSPLTSTFLGHGPLRRCICVYFHKAFVSSRREEQSLFHYSISSTWDIIGTQLICWMTKQMISTFGDIFGTWLELDDVHLGFSFPFFSFLFPFLFSFPFIHFIPLLEMNQDCFNG